MIRRITRKRTFGRLQNAGDRFTSTTARVTAPPWLTRTLGGYLMKDAGQERHEDGCVKAMYPDNGDGDRADPEAVPGLRPEPKGAVGVTSLTVEVDGEMFALRPNDFGGTDHNWLSGPNPGYGFGVSPTPNLSLGEHMENIRDFLAIVDLTTGYIEDD